MEKPDISSLNKKIAKILTINRRRSRLSREQVSKRVPGLTADQLLKFETGEVSPPCNVIYKLIWETYQPTEEEIFFFCCPTAPSSLNFQPLEPLNDL